MQRRSLIALVLGCLAVVIMVVSVILVISRQQEPQYNWRTLSEWLGTAQIGKLRGASSSEAREAAEAIRQIGTNALPFLVRWISYETPAWRRQIYGALFSLTPTSRDNPFVRSVLGAKTEERSWQAMSGFEILSAEASPAVPDLARLMQNGKAILASNLATRR
jgi:hypothetical protein